MSREINLIVIHCAASPNGRSLTVASIDEMHRQRGFRRSRDWRARLNYSLGAIGYHFVIYTSGALATGRHMGEIGAHVAGHNARSLGICMIGTDRFTAAQWTMLESNVIAIARSLAGQRGDARNFEETPQNAIATFERLGVRVVGHRDLSPDLDGDGTVEPREWLKTCPGFDVATWLRNGMLPEPAHVFDPAADAPDPRAAQAAADATVDGESR